MTSSRVRTRASKTVRGAINAVGQGRPRKNTLNRFNDEVITGSIKVPEQLQNDKLACSIWQQTTAILIARGNFKLAQSLLVMAYCKSASIYFSSAEDLVRLGVLEVDPATGERCESLTGIQHKAFQQMIKTGSLLGLDPLSELRTGLIKEAKQKEELDERSDFSEFD